MLPTVVCEQCVDPCVCVCVLGQTCTCENARGNWCASYERVNLYVCVRVSEDSIWTVPSLPVGKGTTWLYVHRSLTFDLSGSCMHKPRYLHLRRHTSTVSQPAVSRCSYTAREREREEERGRVGRADAVVFSGCQNKFGIHSDFSEPMCHSAGETTQGAHHAIPNMSSGSGTVNSEERKTPFWPLQLWVVTRSIKVNITIIQEVS